MKFEKTNHVPYTRAKDANGFANFLTKAFQQYHTYFKGCDGKFYIHCFEK